MILLALGLASLQDTLPPYATSLRCAGLIEASMATAEPQSADWKRYRDGALFWGMAASEGARAEKMTSDAFAAAQTAMRTTATEELEAGDPEVLAERDACMAGVPPLG